MPPVSSGGAAEKPWPSRDRRLKAFFDEACNGELRCGMWRVLSRLQIGLDVFSNHSGCEVHRVAGFAFANIGVFVGVGNHGDFGDVVLPAGHGEADAVNGDGALENDVASEIGGHLHSEPPVFAFGSEMRYAADGVHVAKDEVPAEFLARSEWLLEIDACSNF